MISSATRRLLRAPGFTVLAVAILAIGIGSVTAMYAVVERVVLRPLPVDAQDRLVVAWSNNHARSVEHFPYFWIMYDAAIRGAPALAELAATPTWGTVEAVIEEEDGALTPLRSAPVLGDFFGVLGVEPILGRLLRAEEDVPGTAERVAVISEGLWARRFGRSPDVLGRTLSSRGGPLTIVGVLPGDFDYPGGADVWTPMRPLYSTGSDGSLPPLLELDLLARLAPGATAALAAEQLEALSHSDPELERIYGANTVPVVRPFTDVVLGDLGDRLWLLFAGAGLLLLVAALDAANLVLVRAVGRRQDVAVRRALGADGWQLLREATAEATVLGASAGLLGAAVEWAWVRLLLPMAPEGLPRLDAVRGLDPTAYVVALGATAAVMMVAVVLPLWHAERSDPASALRAASGGSRSGGAVRVRDMLAAGQVALTVWVLVVGALMMRTLANLQSLELGFEADDLTVVSLDRLPTDEPVEAQVQQMRRTIEHLEGNPGVIGATHLLSAPLPGTASYQSIVFLEGQEMDDALSSNPYLFLHVIEPDVFEVMGARVVEGRRTLDSDDAGALPVVVVNEAAARVLWPGSQAVGQRVRAPVDPYLETWWTVVGVVADTRYDELLEPRPAVYFPIGQFDRWLPTYLLVRTDDTHPPVLELVREALAATGPTVRAKEATTVSSRLDEPLARPRFAALILTVLAGVTLLLAAVGVYGVMAFLVRSRRREIGIRLACGATPTRVGELVVRHGLLLALAGGASGAAAAVASAAVFEALLYEVKPTDPTSVLVAITVAVACTLGACGLPAARAAGVEPAEVLRAE